MLNDSKSVDSIRNSSAEKSKQYLDMSSGAAALEIAEAFLNGSIARDIADQSKNYKINVDSSDLFSSLETINRNNPTRDISSGVGWRAREGGWVADFGSAHTATIKAYTDSSSDSSSYLGGLASLKIEENAVKEIFDLDTSCDDDSIELSSAASP